MHVQYNYYAETDCMLTDLRCDANCLILLLVRVFITSFCNNIYN
jgi:hypothetical protein